MYDIGSCARLVVVLERRQRYFCAIYPCVCTVYSLPFISFTHSVAAQDVFKGECNEDRGGICVIAFLPHILDDQVGISLHFVPLSLVSPQKQPLIVTWSTHSICQDVCHKSFRSLIV